MHSMSEPHTAATWLLTQAFLSHTAYADEAESGPNKQWYRTLCSHTAQTSNDRPHGAWFCILGPLLSEAVLVGVREAAAGGMPGMDAGAGVQELQAMAEEGVPYGFLALGHHLVHGQHVQANPDDVGSCPPTCPPDELSACCCRAHAD